MPYGVMYSNGLLSAEKKQCLLTRNGSTICVPCMFLMINLGCFVHPCVQSASDAFPQRFFFPLSLIAIVSDVVMCCT